MGITIKANTGINTYFIDEITMKLIKRENKTRLTPKQKEEKKDRKDIDEDSKYLAAFSTLLSMGFKESISLQAAKKFDGDINRCVEYITLSQSEDHLNADTENMNNEDQQ